MNLASEKQPLASEIIADQQKEIESLKAELQDKQENLDICAGLADRYMYRLDNSERLFFGFFDAFVSYAAVTATFFPISLMLHHAHTIKQPIPAAFNFFSVFSAFLRSV